MSYALRYKNLVLSDIFSIRRNPDDVMNKQTIMCA